MSRKTTSRFTARSVTVGPLSAENGGLSVAPITQGDSVGDVERPALFGLIPEEARVFNHDVLRAHEERGSAVDGRDVVLEGRALNEDFAYAVDVERPRVALHPVVVEGAAADFEVVVYRRCGIPLRSFAIDEGPAVHLLPLVASVIGEHRVGDGDEHVRFSDGVLLDHDGAARKVSETSLQIGGVLDEARFVRRERSQIGERERLCGIDAGFVTRESFTVQQCSALSCDGRGSVDLEIRFEGDVACHDDLAPDGKGRGEVRPGIHGLRLTGRRNGRGEARRTDDKECPAE